MLERGPSQPLFEDEGMPADLDEEFGFCEALRQRGGGGASGQAELEATFGAHRKRHVTEETILQVKALGLNCVRVPFGYWVVTGPTRGDPYCGPCMEHLDNVVQWCEKHGLQVLLDLHGLLRRQGQHFTFAKAEEPRARRMMRAILEAGEQVATDFYFSAGEAGGTDAVEDLVAVGVAPASPSEK